MVEKMINIKYDVVTELMSEVILHYTNSSEMLTLLSSSNMKEVIELGYIIKPQEFVSKNSEWIWTTYEYETSKLESLINIRAILGYKTAKFTFDILKTHTTKEINYLLYSASAPWSHTIQTWSITAIDTVKNVIGTSIVYAAAIISGPIITFCAIQFSASIRVNSLLNKLNNEAGREPVVLSKAEHHKMSLYMTAFVELDISIAVLVVNTIETIIIGPSYASITISAALGLFGGALIDPIKIMAIASSRFMDEDRLLSMATYALMKIIPEVACDLLMKIPGVPGVSIVYALLMKIPGVAGIAANNDDDNDDDNADIMHNTFFFNNIIQIPDLIFEDSIYNVEEQNTKLDIKVNNADQIIEVINFDDTNVIETIQIFTDNYVN